MIWTTSHDEILVREILVTEPYHYKQGTVKRGEAWTQIADNLNAVVEPTFRVNQRSVRDRYTALERAFKKKNREEETSSGTAPPDLSDIELAIQDIIAKFEDLNQCSP